MSIYSLICKKYYKFYSEDPRIKMIDISRLDIYKNLTHRQK
jgi:hypothetical protein